MPSPFLKQQQGALLLKAALLAGLEANLVTLLRDAGAA